ncbi:MAG: NAD(P)-dependent oxidoreductase [Oscillospiraceae bacterium]|jgi:nucleoside-diphosphate-sugar epimerase|nr:NAD(P)-dependent oxidoreductase [Oscillospiraceae bacterium]
MNVLVTGNLGYIGSVMVPYLVKKNHRVSGLDTGYYAGDAMYPFRQPVARQINKDIRDVEPGDFAGYDAVIHLAALSNDPIGELNPSLTEEINLRATLRVAECAKRAGVSRFLFASSPSIYGISSQNSALDEDAAKAPLTVYARTKWQAEQQLGGFSGGDFFCVYLRPSTAYGASPMFRGDLVFNNFIACAYTTGKIEIKSDGAPWRPLAHVEDIAEGFAAALAAPRELVENRAFHIGVPGGNYTVRDIAQAAQNALPQVPLTFSGEHARSRSYQASFRRILTELGEYYRPRWNLEKSAAEILALFEKVHFSREDFEGPRTIRIQRLQTLLEEGKLTSALRWKV